MVIQTGTSSQGDAISGIISLMDTDFGIGGSSAFVVLKREEWLLILLAIVSGDTIDVLVNYRRFTRETYPMLFLLMGVGIFGVNSFLNNVDIPSSSPGVLEYGSD